MEICGEAVPISEQRKQFFALRGSRDHSEFNTIKFQESDQPAIYHAIHTKPEAEEKKSKKK